jgi:hypothetical protein
MPVWAWQLNRLKPKSSRSLLGQNPAPAGGRAYFRGTGSLPAATESPASASLGGQTKPPSASASGARGHGRDGTATAAAPQALA